jgi:hypothetical protein
MKSLQNILVVDPNKVKNKFYLMFLLIDEGSKIC